MRIYKTCLKIFAHYKAKMAIEGYMVCPGLIKDEDGICDYYMQKRQEFFGLAQTSPTLHVQKGSRIELCPGPLGLVQTMTQAKQLLATLENRFPNRDFVIRRWTDSNATRIDWHQAE